jgi:Tol biopolymer transport system component
MAIEPGQQLLHYRLIEKIGEGGMGVVWKALDTTLDREVAIKVLPATLADDPDRVARLAREAKLLASLNHPRIATVHGLHQDGDIRFFVLELVEGEDLSERLERGPIPHDEAIEIARQIAEGLEAAHAAGVIHRDLKPANIKIGSDGRVKVLDFGLARAFETTAASGSDQVSPTMSPTLTSAGTLAGVILGTAAYMSPEQARGHSVDNRSDVWSFGVVLYEMLSGRAAFKGDTVSDTLASVLKLDPDFDALPASVPRRIRRLVTRCLQKDRRQRLHHIADARITLEETQVGVPDDEAPRVVAPQKSRTTERLLWLAAIVLVAVVAAIAWYLQPTPAEPPQRKILLALDGEDPDDPVLQGQAISPDGTKIMYLNGDKLFVRDLDDWTSREISAAEGADWAFWSHDGESIGFIVDRQLSRVSPDGSNSSVVSGLPAPAAGAAWGPDGTIYLAGFFFNKPGLYTVSERGGELKELHAAEEGTHFHEVEILPDDRGVLLSVHGGDRMRLALLSDGELKTLLEFETNFSAQQVYSRTGHVLYRRGETNEGVWALPFSLDTLEATGEPFLVASDGEAPTISRDGTLTYQKFTTSLMRRLVWADREGRILSVIGNPQEGFHRPALSPDLRRIAVQAGVGTTNSHIWIVDVARGAQMRLTFGENKERNPIWTPDGKRVLYLQEVDDDPSAVMITNADGSGEQEKLVEAEYFSLSPDGRYLVLTRRGEGTGLDLWYLELESGGEPRPLLQTEFDERRGQVSPDGAYLAYDSRETGRNEIYLKRFPSGEGKWQASIDGGTRPRWSPEGDELFWILDGQLMVVEVQTQPELTLGTPRRLFSWEPAWMIYRQFDMTPDAQRFLMVTQEERPETPNQIMMIENWSGE